MHRERRKWRRSPKETKWNRVYSILKWIHSWTSLLIFDLLRMPLFWMQLMGESTYGLERDALSKREVEHSNGDKLISMSRWVIFDLSPFLDTVPLRIFPRGLRSLVYSNLLNLRCSLNGSMIGMEPRRRLNGRSDRERERSSLYRPNSFLVSSNAPMKRVNWSLKRLLDMNRRFDHHWTLSWPISILTCNVCSIFSPTSESLL